VTCPKSKLVPRFKNWIQISVLSTMWNPTLCPLSRPRDAVWSKHLQANSQHLCVQLLCGEIVQGMGLASPLLTSCIKWEEKMLTLPTERTQGQMSPRISVIFSPYTLISPSGGWRRLLFLGSFLQFDACASNHYCHLLASPLVY
jgi:hypothetical protein